MTSRAQDGLPARVSGPWTRDKLSYVERYATAFMRAMAPKRKVGKWSELVYLDLLAGPGKGIDRETRAEFDGSPLRALKVAPPFDRLFLSDLRRKNVEALRRRIPPGDVPRVELRIGDCNLVVREVVRQLSRHALGLAFIDPQGFEVKFPLFEVLASRRIDVLFLFPSRNGVTSHRRSWPQGGP